MGAYSKVRCRERRTFGFIASYAHVYNKVQGLYCSFKLGLRMISTKTYPIYDDFTNSTELVFTARKRGCRKVMFLHLSVILFWGGGVHTPRQTTFSPLANTPPPPPRRPLHRTVRILLECILVRIFVCMTFKKYTKTRTGEIPYVTSWLLRRGHAWSLALLVHEHSNDWMNSFRWKIALLPCLGKINVGPPGCIFAFVLTRRLRCVNVTAAAGERLNYSVA